MTIPAKRIVAINPSVISGGGNPLAMNGLFMTQSLAMPTKSVFGFASTAAVAGFFGPASPEALQAPKYFGGYNNSPTKPGLMLFAPFNLAARAAFLQGGSLAGVPLTQIQAMTGTLTVTVDGTAETSAAINLEAATSFTNAATLILAGFTTPAFTVAWNSVASAFVFTSTLTGATATIIFAAGTLAAGLNLTAATGAILSQGAIADTPATAMDNVLGQSQNWATFLTMWEPVVADKLAFLTWSSEQDERFAYLGWDSDPNASVQGNTTCFGALATAQGLDAGAAYSGDPALAVATGVSLASLALDLATFVAGAVASIAFASPNGRRTIAFLASSLIQPTCNDDQIGQNLLANGYSFYGTYATANTNFIFLNNGQMFGPFKWLNTYVQQIYLNSQFQVALMTLLTQIGSDSYTPQGYGLIRNTLQDPINAALAFGTIRAGVTLSAEQIAVVNQAANVNAASIIQTQGSFLQILDPGAQARSARLSPIINFWYADGDDIQQITMGSTAIL